MMNGTAAAITAARMISIRTTIFRSLESKSALTALPFKNASTSRHYLSSTLLRRKTTMLVTKNPNNKQVITTKRFLSSKPSSSTTSSSSSNKTNTIKSVGIGSGKQTSGETIAASSEISRTRGPVSWSALGLVAITAASLVAYYQIERERRLEEAMGKVVSSEYYNYNDNQLDDINSNEVGWSPNPEILAKRKWKKTKYGWFPIEDAFGGAGKPAIGGPWTLIDLNGNIVSNKNFEGKWLLLYFGFARCPDICPSEMVKIGNVMDILKKEYPKLHDKIQPLFISVDPARDSLKALKEYSKDFHPSFTFLTGSPEQVQSMAKKYRVYVSKADETDDGDYLVDHSIVIYFHDDTGDLADCFTQSMRPTDIINKILERMS